MFWNRIQRKFILFSYFRNKLSNNFYPSSYYAILFYSIIPHSSSSHSYCLYSWLLRLFSDQINRYFIIDFVLVWFDIVWLARIIWELEISISSLLATSLEGYIASYSTTLHCTALRFSVCPIDSHHFILFLFILFHIPFLPSFLYHSIFTLLLFLPSSLSLSFSSVHCYTVYLILLRPRLLQIEFQRLIMIISYFRIVIVIFHTTQTAKNFFLERFLRWTSLLSKMTWFSDFKNVM